jgi:hypothetical protein
MLTSKSVNEGLAAVIEALKASDYDGAKKRLNELSESARNDRQRGGIAATGGILTSLMRPKEGGLQTWDQDKLLRAAKSISQNQLADDFDAGVAEALAKYARAPSQAKTE